MKAAISGVIVDEYLIVSSAIPPIHDLKRFGMTHNSEPKDAPFWQKKSLSEMTKKEWESLCDGCGLCCLLKFQNVYSKEIHYTDVACRLFDPEACRCSQYKMRTKIVAACVRLTPDNVAFNPGLPATCAYRLIAEGHELLPWHPLVSGDTDSVHAAGISAKNRTISEDLLVAGEAEYHVVPWTSSIRSNCKKV